MLIDDRPERQKRFYENTKIDISEYFDILDNFTAEIYEELLKEFEEDNFLRLDNYEVIIAHSSAFKEIRNKVMDTFKNICKKKKKSLIFFSGGISSIYIKNEPFKQMLLNSKKFYSQNLELFLKMSREGESNPLVLAFGEKWKINLLLNSLEKINIYIEKKDLEEDILYEEFEDETQLDLIKDFLEFEKPDEEFIKMDDLKKLAKKLTNQIKQQIVLNV